MHQWAKKRDGQVIDCPMFRSPVKIKELSRNIFISLDSLVKSYLAGDSGKQQSWQERLDLAMEVDIPLMHSKYFDAMSKDDEAEQLRALIHFRNSSQVPLELEDILRMQLLPRVVRFLRIDCSKQLQHEAEWLLTGIAAGNSEQTRAVIEAGAIPPLIELLTAQLQVRSWSQQQRGLLKIVSLILR